jgi:taurine dioxygenase
MSAADSEALLDALWAQATQTRFTMCHRWQVGDLLMWNNLAVLHRRAALDPNAPRVMHRTQSMAASGSCESHAPGHEGSAPRVPAL